MRILSAIHRKLCHHFHAQGPTGGIPCFRQDTAAVKTFRTMGQKLMSVPILAYPRFHGKPFILDTDFRVNPDAMGGVLLQEPGSQELVTTCRARQLQPLEPVYALIRGELSSGKNCLAIPCPTSFSSCANR